MHVDWTRLPVFRHGFRRHVPVNCGGDGKIFLSMNVIGAGGNMEMHMSAEAMRSKDLYLRTDLDIKRNRGTSSFSLDGESWTPMGSGFNLACNWRTGTFPGKQFAIFCFNPHPGEGFVDVDHFRFADKDGQNLSRN